MLHINKQVDMPENKQYFNRLSRGFTLGELSIVLVVMTLAVMVTLPITLSKLKKVDYMSYWMGYELMKNIAANIIGDFDFSVDGSNPYCALETADGSCFSAPFVPEYLSKEECESFEEKIKKGSWTSHDLNSGGINIYLPDDDRISYGCYYDGDPLVGMEKGCYDLDAELKQKYGEDAKARSITHIHSFDIYDELYNGSVRDNDRAIAAGFISSPQDTFILLVNNYFFGNDAQCFKFSPTGNIGWEIFERYKSQYEADKDNANANQWAKFSNLYGLCSISIENAEENYANTLCVQIEEKFNTANSNCSAGVSAVKNAASSGVFKNVTPHIEFTNGLRLYIGSNYGEIAELSDTEDASDKNGFVVYVDVNGKSGHGKLWEDVFPFYLLESGKIIPAYNDVTPAGGNNMDHLKVNVVYDDYSGPNRALKLLMKDANFRSAACAVGYVKSEKYCDGKVQYDLCKDIVRDCRMIVKEPVKMF